MSRTSRTIQFRKGEATVRGMFQVPRDLEEKPIIPRKKKGAGALIYGGEKEKGRVSLMWRAERSSPGLERKRDQQ